MKKKFVIGSAIASTLTASTMTASLALTTQFAKRMLYRDQLNLESCSEWCAGMNAKKFKIKNHKDMHLQAYMFEKDNAKRTVICLHPFLKSSGDLKETVTLLQDMFNDANILLYDANAHGVSDGYIRGFGYRDVFDLMYFNTYVLQKYGEDHRVVVYGQGMGANTMLNAAGLGKLKNVDCLISEGAFEDVYHYLAHLCQSQIKVSQYVSGPILRHVIKKEMKYDIKKMDTVSMVKKNTIPTAYIHAKNDKDVPFASVLSLYNKAVSEKFLFPIKDHYLYELKGKEDEYLSSLYEFVHTYTK